MDVSIINKLEQYYGLYKLCHNYINIPIPGNGTDDAVNKYNIHHYKNSVNWLKGDVVLVEKGGVIHGLRGDMVLKEMIP